MIENLGPIVLRFVLCFLAGSVPFAVISMLGTGIDIRKVGSGNPGFNNVLRVSKGRAVLALAGDMGKGYLAVWLMWKAWPVQALWAGREPTHTDVIILGWLYGFAAVLGHCYSPFLRFNGGKGIATSGGVMLVLYPMWALVALAYFAAARLTFAKLKRPEAGTVASLTTWVLFVLLMLVLVGRRDAVCALVMLLFLTWRHQSNLHRLLAPKPQGQLEQPVIRSSS